MAWFNAVLATVSLGLGLLHVVRLATARRDGRPVVGEAAHAAMSFGMAGMFSPFGDPVPAPVWIVVFGLSAAWFAAASLRTGPVADDAGHHVVCGLAMLFMIGIGTGESAVATGHAAHHGAAMTAPMTTAAPAAPPAWISLVAIVLAGYFAWHVLRCGDRFAGARRARIATAEPVAVGAGAVAAVPMVETCAAAAPQVAVEGRLGALRTPQAAAIAHLVMASAMAVMLLAMI